MIEPSNVSTVIADYENGGVEPKFVFSIMCSSNFMVYPSSEKLPYLVIFPELATVHDRKIYLASSPPFS